MPPTTAAPAPDHGPAVPAAARRDRTGAGSAPTGPAGRRPSRRGRTAGTRPTSPAQVEQLARAVALLWLEVESGRRRPASVAHLLDHRLWQRLRRRWVRGGPAGQLVRLLVHHHSSTQCDAVAVVRRGPRSGAITFRLRQRRDGWCVVEADRPEDVTPGAVAATGS